MWGSHGKLKIQSSLVIRTFRGIKALLGKKETPKKRLLWEDRARTHSDPRLMILFLLYANSYTLTHYACRLNKTLIWVNERTPTTHLTSQSFYSNFPTAVPFKEEQTI